jgi:hypothetical protein
MGGHLHGGRPTTTVCVANARRITSPADCTPGVYLVRELIKTTAPGIWRINMTSSSTTTRKYQNCRVLLWELTGDVRQGISRYLNLRCQQLTLPGVCWTASTWRLDQELYSEADCNAV